MSYGSTEGSPGPQVWQVSLLALGIAVMATALGTFGIVFGLASGSDTFAVVLRSLLSLLVLVVLLFYFTGRWGVVSRRAYVLAALAAHVLDPYSWNGKLLFGQAFGTIPVAIVVDLVVWMAISWAVISLQESRTRSSVSQPLVGYGQSS